MRILSGALRLSEDHEHLQGLCPYRSDRLLGDGIRAPDSGSGEGIDAGLSRRPRPQALSLGWVDRPLLDVAVRVILVGDLRDVAILKVEASEASRAFTRERGTSPGRYRRAMRASTSSEAPLASGG